MLTDKEIQDIFAPITWNSEVRLKEPSDVTKHGFERGAVVALTVIETSELAAIMRLPIGAKVVHVEGPAGNSIALPVEAVDLVVE